MNTNQEEVKVLNEQLLATTLFIGALFVSLSLTFDTRQKIKGEKRLYNNKNAKYIAIINRIVIVFIVLFYIQIDNENIQIAKEKHKNLRLLNLQKLIEFITLCTALLALYISVNSTTDNNIATIENPNV